MSKEEFKSLNYGDAVIRKDNDSIYFVKEITKHYTLIISTEIIGTPSTLELFNIEK